MQHVFVGDVHGCISELKKLIDTLKNNKIPLDSVTILGDVIDRGEHSKKCLEFIIDNKFDMLIGNHEEMMIDSFIELHSDSIEVWLNNGGIQTIMSFLNGDEIDKFRKEVVIPIFDKGIIPRKLDSYIKNRLANSIDFFKTLKYFKLIKCNNFSIMVSHSGGNEIIVDKIVNDKLIDLSSNEIYSLLWDRGSFGSEIKNVENSIVIHGHTPNKEIEIYNLKNNVKQINIDTGCVYKKKYGKLSACVIDSETGEIKFFDSE